jgi:hypothetical protein
MLVYPGVKGIESSRLNAHRLIYPLSGHSQARMRDMSPGRCASQAKGGGGLRPSRCSQ